MNLDTMRRKELNKNYTQDDARKHSHDHGIYVGVGQVRVESIGTVNCQLKVFARLFGSVHGFGSKDVTDPILANLWRCEGGGGGDC